MSDAMVNCGMMWPVRMVGRPLMKMSHSWVDVILLPSGRFTLMVFFVTRLFETLVASMTKMDDAPVSAMV